jgi:cytochrome c peroxidase
MNGNPRVPASPGGRSDAPTVIVPGCAQILLPGKGKRLSIWGMSVVLCLAAIFPTLADEKGEAVVLGAPIFPAQDSEAKRVALLGRELFYDVRLSADRTISCASCHQSQAAFADARAVSIGVVGREGRRHAPSLFNVAALNVFGWDGAGATLETQILRALTAPHEMALSPAQVDNFLPTSYPNWRKIIGLNQSAREGLLGLLAAFVRSLVTGNSRFDRYLFATEHEAMTPSEIRGFELFRGKARCIACHTVQHATTDPSGGFHASFSDGKFHAIGVEKVKRPGALSDIGRAAVTGELEDYGKFKTPTLRNVSLQAHFMHNGSIDSLESVVDFYDRGGNNDYNRDRIIHPLRLTSTEKFDLAAVLRALTDSCYEATTEPRCWFLAPP